MEGGRTLDEESKHHRRRYGYQHASWLSRLTYWFVNPLIRWGAKGEIDEHVGRLLLPDSDCGENLNRQFSESYKEAQGDDAARSIWWCFLRIHKVALAKHMTLACMETAARIAQPIFLRHLLDWFSSAADDQTTTNDGWLWASLIAVFAYLYVLIHHQTFWNGMRNGMRMRCQMIAQIQSKVLRLNGSALAKITSGKIINLVSNDVRRFDEAGTFWVFLIVGPLELIAVFILIGTRLGYLASFAGVSSLLMLIPIQSVLARYIGRLRAAIAAQTDERVRLTGEAITGITAFKMLAWEKPLYLEILKVRQKEQVYIGRMNMIRATNMALSFAIMPLVSFITFTVARYTIPLEDFTVSSVFFAVSLLALPKLTMCEFFVHAVEALSELRVSVRRIGSFLAFKEPHDLMMMDPRLDRETDVLARINHADFMWQEDGGVSTLKDVEFCMKRGEIVCVVGAVGSGKTSLLNALMGEMTSPSCDSVPVQIMHGHSLSYCSQKPWIVSGSIQDNIVFGSVFDEDWYNVVIAACCLDEDIASLPHGDCTMIGERGINLSGGQKARLAMARAMYKKAAINLFDDPLSALDSKVGAQVFSRCLSHEDGIIWHCMENNIPPAILLVTHQKQYLAHCDRIIVLRGGQIAAQGTFDDLAAQGIPEVVTMTQDESEHDDESIRLSNSTMQRGRMIRSSSGKSLLSKKDSVYWRKFVSSRFDVSQKIGSATSKIGDSFCKLTESGKIIVKEDQETGSVSWGVYKDLIMEFGLLRACFVLVCLLGGQALFIFGDYWLADWANSDDSTKVKSYWIWAYSIFVGAILVISIVRAQVFFKSSLRASNSMHRTALNHILRAPLSFFHTNPSGRILNRFSKDLGVIDEQLPQVTFDSLQAGMMVFGALVLLCVVVPVILPIFVPLIGIFVLIQRRYLRTSRELKRFEAVTRSPLYQNFNNVLKGLTVIRAFRAQAKFRGEFLTLLSNNISWWFCWMTAARWIGFRLDVLVALLMTAAPLLMVGLRDKLGEDNVKLVGLALSQSLYLAGLLQWMVRQTAEVENNMTSTERVFAYTRLDQEPPGLEEGGQAPPKEWPTKGTIEYSKVFAVYRKGLPPVLKDLSFRIEGGTSCGIVGRTGSGKSSLMLSLFRLIPIIDGTVYIDDVDVSKIALDSLRGQVAIIPQDPVLFSGSLRDNLDPWNRYSDAVIWQALEKAQLKSLVLSMSDDKGLYVNLQECGDNLSCGQKQLLCLARVLLQEDAQILALDEATANVDSSTDIQIQNAVHQVCNGSIKRTLLVIAHRLDTIMTCDDVIVLAQGELVEQGSPSTLLENEHGAFHSMAKSSKMLDKITRS